MRNPKLTIVQEGKVKLSTLEGYDIVGNKDVVAFYIDCDDYVSVDGFSETSEGLPSILCYLDVGDGAYTEIAFPDYPKWTGHSVRGGKTISVCLINERSIKHIDIKESLYEYLDTILIPDSDPHPDNKYFFTLYYYIENEPRFTCYDLITNPNYVKEYNIHTRDRMMIRVDGISTAAEVKEYCLSELTKYLKDNGR